jgi:type II secretory pathway component HofQ
VKTGAAIAALLLHLGAAPVAPPAPGAETPSPAARTVTLDVQHARVAGVLQLLADVANLNLVHADGVADGRITLQLKDVRWQDALVAVLQTQDLSVSCVGNVLWIQPLVGVPVDRSCRALFARGLSHP